MANNERRKEQPMFPLKKSGFLSWVGGVKEQYSADLCSKGNQLEYSRAERVSADPTEQLISEDEEILITNSVLSLVSTGYQLGFYTSSKAKKLINLARAETKYMIEIPEGMFEGKTSELSLGMKNGQE